MLKEASLVRISKLIIFGHERTLKLSASVVPTLHIIQQHRYYYSYIFISLAGKHENGSAK